MNSFLASTPGTVVFLAVICVFFSAIGGWVLDKQGPRLFGLAYAIMVIVFAPVLWAFASLTYLKEEAWTADALGVWFLWTVAVFIPSALTLLLIRRWRIGLSFRIIAATLAGAVVVPIAPYVILIVGCSIMGECI